MRVLIADDNRNFGLFLRSSLMTRGYQARAVVNAEEALAAGCEDRYDMFLVDASMKDPDGRDLASALLAAANPPAPHLVLMTGNGGETNGSVHPVLRKPFRLTALLQILNDLVPH